jgi:hypothetical protein
MRDASCFLRPVTKTVLLVAVVLAGCGSSAYFYGPLGAVVAPPKPKGCSFDLVDKRPEQAFDPLGVLAPLDIEATKLPADDAAFKKAVEAEVCAAGGDAVVVERDRQGRRVRGTVVRWR